MLMLHFNMKQSAPILLNSFLLSNLLMQSLQTALLVLNAGGFLHHLCAVP